MRPGLGPHRAGRIAGGSRGRRGVDFHPPGPAAAMAPASEAEAVETMRPEMAAEMLAAEMLAAAMAAAMGGGPGRGSRELKRGRCGAGGRLRLPGDTGPRAGLRRRGRAQGR